MNRHLGGALVLVIGLLAALLVPRVLDAGVAGVASRAPAPGPPAVGSCVLWPGYEVVDCEAPHTAEVVQTWATASVSEAEQFMGCQDQVAVYMSLKPTTVSSRWHLPSADFGGLEGFSSASYVTFSAPERERLGGPGWTACAVVTAEPPTATTDRVKDVLVPNRTGWCAPDEATLLAMQFGPVCDFDHRVEVVGMLNLALGEPGDIGWAGPAVQEFPSQQAAKLECEQIARFVLEGKDPTFDGRLELVLDYQLANLDVLGIGEETQTLFAICYLLAGGDHVLTDTLVGIGDKPLPMHQ